MAITCTAYEVSKKKVRGSTLYFFELSGCQHPLQRIRVSVKVFLNLACKQTCCHHWLHSLVAVPGSAMHGVKSNCMIYFSSVEHYLLIGFKCATSINSLWKDTTMLRWLAVGCCVFCFRLNEYAYELGFWLIEWKKQRSYFTPRARIFILGVQYNPTFSEKNPGMQPAYNRISVGDAENFNV